MYYNQSWIGFLTKGNMINEKFGAWTVIEYDPTIKPGRHWKCKCSCGIEKIISGTTLRAGRSLSCVSCSYANRKEDIIGKHIFDWTVIEYVGRIKKNQVYKIQCKCGLIKTSPINDIGEKKSKRCHICHNRAVAKGNITHNLHKSPTNRIWRAMKQRCTNPKATHYNRYGGRGIKYDPRWKKFQNFLDDMGLKPNGLTLDRINNNGNYEKSNCRWVTHKENCNNRYYDEK